MRRAQEHGNEEEQAAEDGGKTGASARCDASIDFAEGRNGGSAADSADSSGDGVGKHALVHIDGLAVLVHEACTLACRIQGAESIEHVHHAERQTGGAYCEYEVRAAMDFSVSSEIKSVFEYCIQGLGGKFAERLKGAHGGTPPDCQILQQPVSLHDDYIGIQCILYIFYNSERKSPHMLYEISNVRISIVS